MFFDLLLVDLVLPDLPGLELIKQIRATGNRTPIIVLTGFPAFDSCLEAGRSDVIEYLQKPIEPQILCDRLALAMTDASDARAPNRFLPIPIGGPVRDRVSAAIVRGVFAKTDLRTLDQFARHVGVSASTFKGWCAIIGIRPREALLFTRLLRAITLQLTCGTAVVDSLDISDTRTLWRLFVLAGLPNSRESVISIAIFVSQQRLVRDAELVARIWSLLRLEAQTQLADFPSVLTAEFA